MNASEILDRLMDQLDETWSVSQDSEPDLARLISQISPGTVGQMDIAIELCAADLEWRWRKHMLQPNHLGKQAESYRALLADWWHDTNCRKRMILAEWRARSAVGDQPDVACYSKRWANDADWLGQLLRELDAIGFMTARVTCPGSATFAVRLPSEFVIGRQSHGEPPAPSWLVATRKLIIADIYDTQVSRSQLLVRRSRVNEIELTNCSKTVGVDLPVGDLAPGETCRLAIPRKLVLGDAQLELGVQRL